MNLLFGKKKKSGYTITRESQIDTLNGLSKKTLRQKLSKMSTKKLKSVVKLITGITIFSEITLIGLLVYAKQLEKEIKKVRKQHNDELYQKKKEYLDKIKSEIDRLDKLKERTDSEKVETFSLEMNRGNAIRLQLKKKE